MSQAETMDPEPESEVPIRFKHFDLKRGQVAEHPPPLMALFARICKSGIDPKRFDQRVRQINHLQTAAG